jgi:3-methyladenine DNA glycosylase AlkC
MEPFKNMISLAVAEQTASAIARNYPAFPREQFLKNLEKELKPLELKQRVSVISRRLHDTLSSDLKKNLKYLIGALKQNEKDNIGLSGFAVWPLTDYVSTYGHDEFDSSLTALKAMTKVFTAEWAIRSFIIADPKRVIKVLEEWVDDECEHVRRLVSEGSRPLLPWGQKLPSFVKDPKATWHLLEKLKFDGSEYVRKSVANHLNDHSKNHADFVTDKLLKWKKEGKKSKDLEWIIRHASRTLIKKGHAKAFLLHDVDTAHIEVTAQKILTKKVRLGEVLKVEVTIVNKSSKKQKFILDHEVHLLKANSKHNIKCFKGIKMELDGKSTKKVSLNIPLKAVTTRTYYSGKHFWNTKLNGISYEKLAFTLET